MRSFEMLDLFVTPDIYLSQRLALLAFLLEIQRD